MVGPSDTQAIRKDVDLGSVVGADDLLDRVGEGKLAVDVVANDGFTTAVLDAEHLVDALVDHVPDLWDTESGEGRDDLLAESKEGRGEGEGEGDDVAGEVHVV